MQGVGDRMGICDFGFGCIDRVQLEAIRKEFYDDILPMDKFALIIFRHSLRIFWHCPPCWSNHQRTFAQILKSGWHLGIFNRIRYLYLPRTAILPATSFSLKIYFNIYIIFVYFRNFLNWMKGTNWARNWVAHSASGKHTNRSPINIQSASVRVHKVECRDKGIVRDIYTDKEECKTS